MYDMYAILWVLDNHKHFFDWSFSQMLCMFHIQTAYWMGEVTQTQSLELVKAIILQAAI